MIEHDESRIEALESDVQRLRETLGTLITWLVLELGEAAVDKLHTKLPAPR